jgi:hypothetical protein
MQSVFFQISWTSLVAVTTIHRREAITFQVFNNGIFSVTPFGLNIFGDAYVQIYASSNTLCNN